MKIAVNARSLYSASTNQVSRYTNGLLESLAKNYPQHEFYFFSDRPLPSHFKSFKNITSIQIKSVFQNTFLGNWWYWINLPKRLIKIKADVFFSTDGFTVFKTEIPRITFIPLMAEAPGNIISGRPYMQPLQAEAVQLSDKIVVSSPENSLILNQKYALVKEKILVVNPAANVYFKKLSFGQQVRVREKYAAGESFFLLPELPGSIDNLELVLTGFNLLKNRSQNDLKLIIVGVNNYKELRLDKKSSLKTAGSEVIFTGSVTDKTLAILYAAAVATIYFPVAGGLNLPFLEAQQCGCPLITFVSPAAKESIGTNALFITHLSAEGIFAAMAQVYHHIEFRNILIMKGLEHSARSSWSESSYHQVMQWMETTVKAKNNASTSV